MDFLNKTAGRFWRNQFCDDAWMKNFNTNRISSLGSRAIESAQAISARRFGWRGAVRLSGHEGGQTDRPCRKRKRRSRGHRGGQTDCRGMQTSHFLTLAIRSRLFVTSSCRKTGGNACVLDPFRPLRDHVGRVKGAHDPFRPLRDHGVRLAG